MLRLKKKNGCGAHSLSGISCMQEHGKVAGTASSRLKHIGNKRALLHQTIARFVFATRIQQRRISHHPINRIHDQRQNSVWNPLIGERRVLKFTENIVGNEATSIAVKLKSVSSPEGSRWGINPTYLLLLPRPSSSLALTETDWCLAWELYRKIHPIEITPLQSRCGGCEGSSSYP